MDNQKIYTKLVEIWAEQHGLKATHIVVEEVSNGNKEREVTERKAV